MFGKSSGLLASRRPTQGTPPCLPVVLPVLPLSSQNIGRRGEIRLVLLIIYLITRYLTVSLFLLLAIIPGLRRFAFSMEGTIRMGGQNHVTQQRGLSQ